MNNNVKENPQLPLPGLLKRIRLNQAWFQYQKRNERHILQQLFWECTLRCNLNCLHCGSDCRTTSSMQDMPLADFLLVLDDVRSVMDARKILVVTTGGEPLVRKDICVCGREIRERGFHWGMVSNGMLLDDKMCYQLIYAGLETIAISLDGFEDDHNWLRGNNKSFACAERAIKTLVDKNITWDVITCINQKNYDNLDSFKQYLIDLGVRDWRIFTIVPMGRATTNEELLLSKGQFQSLMDFIVKVRKEGKIRLSYGCEGFLGDYEWKVRDYPYFCQAGINVASVLADGSISGCLSIRSQYHQGNIYKDKFTDVWNKKFTLYRNREWMRTGQCVACDMWIYCQGNGMHLRDNEGNLLL
jgi:radical SAM enzyme (rSAM/lipoprotein system)